MNEPVLRLGPVRQLHSMCLARQPRHAGGIALDADTMHAARQSTRDSARREERVHTHSDEPPCSRMRQTLAESVSCATLTSAATRMDIRIERDAAGVARLTRQHIEATDALRVVNGVSWRCARFASENRRRARARRSFRPPRQYMFQPRLDVH